MSTATNTMGGETPRLSNDAYYTPDALAIAIARRVRESFGDCELVVEPSAGTGAFVRAAHAVWPDALVTAVEPHPANGGGIPEGCAFQDVEWWARRWEDGPKSFKGATTIILGNPPYNLPGDGRGNTPTTAERHVHLALERMRNGDVLAFLLRLAFLGGGGRVERLHAKHPLAALWPVTPRPSFTGGGTDSSEYAVFVWVKGYRGACDLRPLAWSAA